MRQSMNAPKADSISPQSLYGCMSGVGKCWVTRCSWLYIIPWVFG